MTLQTGKGFTLVEALVCLFLVTCLMWGTLPQFLKHQKERELRLAGTTVRQTFSLARQMAVSERCDYEVVLQEGKDTISIRSFKSQERVGKDERLPSGIVVSGISRDLAPLVFKPNGGLMGISGSVTLKDERTGKEKRIIIYNLTGKTRIAE